MADSRPTQYRQIPEGSGGTLIFYDPSASPSPSAEQDQSDLKHLSHIGTDGCLTCVGVYFPIDVKRCFLAHINVLIQYPNFVKLGYRIVQDEAEGERIKTEVLERFRADSTENGWSPESIPADLKRRLVLVCPSITEGSKYWVGHYVIQAICAFLNIPVDEANVDESSSGLVVNHHAFEVFKFAIGNKPGRDSKEGKVIYETMEERAFKARIDTSLRGDGRWRILINRDN